MSFAEDIWKEALELKKFLHLNLKFHMTKLMSGFQKPE